MSGIHGWWRFLHSQWPAPPHLTSRLAGLSAEPDGARGPGPPSYASRSATRQYRTSPLKGAWQHAPSVHDGAAATLDDVVQTCNSRKLLGLTAQEVADLAHYLKSP